MSGAADSPAKLRLATRASALALWQARHVQALLEHACPGASIELVTVSTVGDRDRESRLAAFGGQGVFTREVQAAVLAGRADIAVHSLKDLPTVPAEGLVLAGTPARAARHDVLILPRGQTIQFLQDLPRGARAATGSLRRRAQLLRHRPDLVFVEVRGNVETRLRKLDAGEFDVLVLAAAGLERLGFADRISLPLPPPILYPAVGQGALGLECRSDDATAIQALEQVTVQADWFCVRAERSCLRTLEAGCHAPVGVRTEWISEGRSDPPSLELTAVVLSSDGAEQLISTGSGRADNPESLGRSVAEHLLSQGAERLIRAVE